MTKQILFAALIGLAFSSCRITQQRCAQMFPPPSADTSSRVVIKVIETVKDTTVFSNGDSALWAALIECNEQGQAVIRQLEQERGHKTIIATKTTANAGESHKGIIIQNICHVDSEGIYLTYKSRDKTVQESSVITKPYPVYVPKELTAWEKFKILTGGFTFSLLLFIAVAAIGYIAVKIYKGFNPATWLNPFR